MKVNEIFYSLQGEGFHTGTPAVFIRLSGCNLQCPFCDTDHESGEEMSEEEIADNAALYPARMVVVTGGEPALQLNEKLVELLHDKGRFVTVETNGTMPLPENIDWITLSPKDSFLGEKAAVVLRNADEIKVVYDGVHEPQMYREINASYGRFLQPCDTGDPHRNQEIVWKTIEYVKSHPEWRLSLQTHKILNIR